MDEDMRAWLSRILATQGHPLRQWARGMVEDFYPELTQETEQDG